jgi:DNA/RNA-binding domain of Phe-tRNA-synthetase-like protein
MALTAPLGQDADVGVTHPRLEAWFAAYKAAGIKGERQKVQPGVTALMRRVDKGQGDKIPAVSSLVAATNMVALKHLSPTGAFDLEKVKGPVVLGPAAGGESFRAIATPDKAPTAMAAGQLCLTDQGSGTVICQNWNAKGGADFCISPAVTDVGIDIDMIVGAGGATLEELQQAAQLCADLLRAHCGAPEVSAYLLSQKTPSFKLTDTPTIVLIKKTALELANGPQWIMATKMIQQFGVAQMAASLSKDLVAAVAAAGPTAEKQEAAAYELLKAELNLLQVPPPASINGHASSSLAARLRVVRSRLIARARGRTTPTRWAERPIWKTRTGISAWV